MVIAAARFLYPAAKRLLDIVASALLLAAASPILLAAVVAIRLDSAGPAIFRQKRIGRGMKPFTAYKFRSMTVNCSEEIHKKFIEKLMRDPVGKTGQPGGVCKLVEDARITRVGRFIRHTSIDELPQLINVLKGQMSLVGPRPAIGYELQHHEPWMFERFSVKPGITGWWQVSGRSRTGYRDMVEKDIYYVRHACMRFDLEILCRTVPVVFKTKSAV